MKKYEFTGVTKEEYGVVLKQIRLLVYLPFASKGAIGGWIEKEGNLSHDGNCWIFENGQVSGNGRVFGNGVVSGNGLVFGIVDGNSKISGYVYIPKNHLVSNCEIEGIERRYFRINYAGIDMKTGEHKVRVGCQVHSISRWKNAEVRKRIMSRNRFPKEYEQEFLEILAEIEKKYVLDPFKKIQENIQKLKENVSEELKTETISLISNLPVIQGLKKSEPKRDKFGRFA